MNRTCALALFASILSIPSPAHAQTKPDLRITAFGFSGPTANSLPKPTCEPNTVVYSFAVVVTNAGTGPSPSSTSLGGKPLLTVAAQDRAGWLISLPLPEIPAGKTASATADILFLAADPAYMVKANHPFLATADPGNLVDESDETNNTKGPLTMGPPAGCERFFKKK
ncbi:MAG: CARDB domain-containing protein [Acidobacteriota bacterium]